MLVTVSTVGWTCHGQLSWSSRIIEKKKILISKKKGGGEGGGGEKKDGDWGKLNEFIKIKNH